ncbi:MAG: ATP-binding protein [Actinomycetota bacterium]|nr:ATP-binding protein [Actinomycetota bacterium]
MSSPADEQELWIRAEPAALAEARQVVDRIAEAVGFDEESRHQIRIAANEALTNAVQHGQPCAGRVLLRVVPETGALSVFVRDCGRFTPSMSLPEELPERGRGLAFIRLLMDEVEILPSRDSTVVRMLKRLQRR